MANAVWKRRAGVLQLLVMLCLISTALSDVVVTPEILAACAEETVTATCSVSDTIILQWTPGNFFSESELGFFRLVPQNLGMDPITRTSSNGVTFSAELTDSVMSESGGLFNLQSTLTTTVSSLTNGTILQCRGESPQPHDSATILLMTGPPPAPSGVTVVGTYYNITEVTVNITWDESNESQNYTISLMSECEGRVLKESHDVDIAQFTAQLLYDTNYTISIIAQNCAGNSTADIQHFIKSGCPNGRAVLPSNTQLMCDGPSTPNVKPTYSALLPTATPMDAVDCMMYYSSSSGASSSLSTADTVGITGTSSSLSTASVVAITAVVAGLCSFTAGLLLGVLLTQCGVHCRRKQKRGQTERPPVYEDIQPDEKAGIELKHNEAYGHISR